MNPGDYGNSNVEAVEKVEAQSGDCGPCGGTSLVALETAVAGILFDRFMHVCPAPSHKNMQNWESGRRVDQEWTTTYALESYQVEAITA